MKIPLQEQKQFLGKESWNVLKFRMFLDSLYLQYIELLYIYIYHCNYIAYDILKVGSISQMVESYQISFRLDQPGLCEAAPGPRYELGAGNRGAGFF